MYDIAARVAGRVAGLWSAAAFVVVPVAVTPLFVDRYQERWTDQVLVQFYGLTQLADFPSTVLVLVSAALVAGIAWLALTVPWPGYLLTPPFRAVEYGLMNDLRYLRPAVAGAGREPIAQPPGSDTSA